jgi:hypothetical protein
MKPGDEENYRSRLSGLKGKERSGIRSGVMQGINDLIEMAKEWPEDLRKKADDALATQGYPSMKKLEIQLGKKQKQILKKQKIRNDEEYYIVIEILNDTEAPISDDERKVLNQLILDYEQQKRAEPPFAPDR